jgi:nucleoside-diphosphate kinase
MSGNITFTIVKPDAVSKNYTEAIFETVEKAGFELLGRKDISLTKEQAEDFYKIHSEQPFFPNLIEFMSSGPIVVAALKKENAVENFRLLIGKTNPVEAAEGTIRKKYGEITSRNAIHGSDSDENAQREIRFFFTEDEVRF